jgi:hypothetical protein
VYFRVAAIDLKFFDACGLFEFSDVEGLHLTIIALNDKIVYWLGRAILKNITRNDPRRTGLAAPTRTPSPPITSR